jgi:hypothetical protein
MPAKFRRRGLTPAQKTRILGMNAGVCCVCKTRGKGVNFHHIDGDPSNNSFENIAVLCVESHDAFHRPSAYDKMNHLELGIKNITEHKKEWEEFVKEAKKDHPKVLATVNIFGTKDTVHALKLVFQTIDSKIVVERSYHLLTGPPEKWIDSILDEVQWLGSKIPLVIVDKPLPIEYCPTCGGSLANTFDSNIATKLTATDWKDKSLCGIYINPSQASLGIVISYEGKALFSGTLHKCGKHLHFMCNKFEERVVIKKNQSVRMQVNHVLSRILDDWQPARVLFGTGNEDNPELIAQLSLPEFWEN